ncbi:OmpA family protein [Cytophaga sp. FL35]|uniref:OmpA family protein n=1 Tax=Cytophaga sp. FL35 TaxID=1904456 RepID=UPI0016539CC1|nr:OmpA family protein [Cytophaga sp. FL35]MBC6999489.1 OmpA family protein [Cytophaga sp. FL35]
MKRITKFLKAVITLSILVFFSPDANGQILKRLGKAAERAAERTVERRVEKETTEKTDQVLDSILEPGSSKKTNPPKQKAPSPNSDTESVDIREVENDPSAAPTSTDPQSIKIYSKFDFVPGDETLFLDAFENDFVGDFPSKWNTNSSGDLVTIDDYDEKWLKILPGFNTAYIPDVTELPEDFTLEFDVIAQGLDNKTSSQSFLEVMVSDTNSFDEGANWGSASYSFCQFIDVGIVVENHHNGARVIRNTIAADLRPTVMDKHHISVAVNGQRFRFWINENKYVDVPRLLPEGVKMQGIKFSLRGIDTNKEGIYLSNFKVAKGGVDLRRKLLADGKISTNGILFESGSANIQPMSMGIIRQIYQVLEQNKSLNLKIVGHTDSDGDDQKNMQLSQKRAASVKNALVSIYNISSDRLTTEGKGETEPIGNNGSVEGKAQNRRVEFIKI